MGEVVAPIGVLVMIDHIPIILGTGTPGLTMGWRVHLLSHASVGDGVAFPTLTLALDFSLTTELLDEVGDVIVITFSKPNPLTLSRGWGGSWATADGGGGRRQIEPNRH